MAAPVLGVIADDLTGGAAVAAQLLGPDRQLVLYPQASRVPARLPPYVWPVADTASRGLPAPAAATLARAAAERLLAAGSCSGGGSDAVGGVAAAPRAAGRAP